MKQAKECKSMPPPPVSQASPVDERKNILKGSNDWAIAVINASIKTTMDIVRDMEQQMAADKAEQVELSKRALFPH